MDPLSQPLILYTDASDVPERDPRFVVGAVLFDPETGSMQHTYWVVPWDMVSHWITKETYMGQLEILAGPVAIATWESTIHDKSSTLWTMIAPLLA